MLAAGMVFSLPNAERIFDEAKEVLVGGVNSPVRAFGSVGGTPPFIQRAKGARVWDVDGHRYIDYVGSWGPMILGHAAPKVIKAIKKAASLGTSFGAPTVQEARFASLIQRILPSMEKVRFVNSGTEATMGAIRLARGFTEKSKIIKFAGAYHGHADHLLVQAGSGATTLGVPNSAGVPEEFVQHTLLARFNDLESVQALIAAHHGEIAALIVEPICGNMGVIPPKGSFLRQLSDLLKEEGIVLIFDEVMTGFRVGLTGAQGLYGIDPDLTCLGKIIGGGLPVGAFGGSTEIMKRLAPQGPVYQAGTLSGNPLAMAAGMATLEELVRRNPYKELNERCKQLVDGLQGLAEEKRLKIHFSRVGSMFSFFFTDQEDVSNYDQVQKINTRYYKKFFHALLEEGVYLPPSAYEACFISTAHGTFEIKKTLEAAERAFGVLQ
jgi:glutamate-1-semialdehyde 2,1-aminomutase